MRMTITLTVSEWANAQRRNKPCLSREWSGPPRSDGPNTAACVWEKNKCWPFRSWGWLVWSPYSDDASDKGVAKSEEEAKKAADAALEAFITDAETQIGANAQ